MAFGKWGGVGERAWRYGEGRRRQGVVVCHRRLSRMYVPGLSLRMPMLATACGAIPSGLTHHDVERVAGEISMPGQCRQRFINCLWTVSGVSDRAIEHGCLG